MPAAGPAACYGHGDDRDAQCDPGSESVTHGPGVVARLRGMYHSYDSSWPCLGQPGRPGAARPWSVIDGHVAGGPGR